MINLKRPIDKIIEKEVSGKGITDKKILDALRSIPREKFIEGPLHDFSYIAGPLPIGHNQTISGIYTVALMTVALKPARGLKVLEVGTGSGYQAAVLSALFPAVYTIERIKELSSKARKTAEALGIHNVVFIVGDGTIGYKEFAPYDRIIVTACSPRVPAPLSEQLAEGGIMVLPLEDASGQNIVSVEKKNGKLSSKKIGPANFVRLIGKNGF